MNETAPTGASAASKSCCHASCAATKKSTRLAWTITICEGLLLVGATIALMSYWLMLPVRFRVIGVAGLAGLALFGAYRFVRFHRRSSPGKEAARVGAGTQSPSLATLDAAPGDESHPADSQ